HLYRARLSPVELVAPDFEIWMSGTNQRHRMAPAMHPDRIRRTELRRLLPIDGESRVVIGRLHMNLDLKRVRKHNRTVAQRMRTNWRQYDRAERRINNRASSSERIRSGAGRSRDDQSVSAVRAKRLAVREHVEIEHPAERPFADDYIIERLVSLRV